MPRIELKSLSKVYPNGVRGVEDLSLTLEPGQWWLLLGPSGCGKTTVLRLLAGLEIPTSGIIRIDGVEASGLEPFQRRVALVPQEPALYPHRTVEQNLHFGITPDASHLAEVIEVLGLGGFLRSLPGQLSGGQRQRVALARALVRRAAILLLDEPLAQVDAPGRAEIRARLPLLVRGPTPTIVHVTHDQDEALDLADRVALLEDGRLQQAGSVAELLRDPRSALVGKFLRGSSARPPSGSVDE